MTSSAALLASELPGLIARGKVRDIYDLGDRLLIVASDRISAFDVIMAEPVPGKGRVLTQMSEFWLRTLPACKPHHLDYVVSADRCPEQYESHCDQLVGRAMVVRKVAILPVECVVRGYIVGGGWKEYTATGCVSGVRLPSGLRLGDRLPEPLFTPSTKAASGHDEPISFDQACDHLAKAFSHEQAGPSALLAAMFGKPESEEPAEWEAAHARRCRQLMERVRQRSLDIYKQAGEHAGKRGILLADTKFEFGLLDYAGTAELVLADEVLTPDSSRFWPAESWKPGTNPPSFDKQYLRDYLETLSWPKTPPPPPLPATVIEQTRARYEEAFERLRRPA
ncbi:MAG: phosphoribosylaminoimidazolesuccinocarboxamide synthase [Planctomycetes bacterium]|nr:phosphoribosylaminoimidazolesuccinocarboxamide synthase [Planctomycetota bacterium]